LPFTPLEETAQSRAELEEPCIVGVAEARHDMIVPRGGAGRGTT
jgi:hypothetical protein